jgi:hypothetical protein
VAAAAVGVFAFSLRAGNRPPSDYVIARRSVATGQIVGAGDVTLAPLDLSPAVARHAFRGPVDVVGRVALAPVMAGELLQEGALAASRAGLGGRMVAVPVDDSQIDLLQIGGWVDVLVTQGQGSDGQTEVVASGARLLGVVRPKSTLGVSSTSVAQLAVADFGTVKALVQAAHTGALTLVPAPGSAGG